jgi:acyl dehydratase
MTDFDPARHRMVQAQRWFEDFTLGERFVIPSRTQTSAVFAAFQTASGDTHPIHYDIEYCRARGMPAQGCFPMSWRNRWSASSSSQAGS